MDPTTSVTPGSIARCGPNFRLLLLVLSLCMVLHIYFICGLVEYASTDSHLAYLLLRYTTLLFKLVGILLLQIISNGIRIIEGINNKYRVDIFVNIRSHKDM